MKYRGRVLHPLIGRYGALKPRILTRMARIAAIVASINSIIWPLSLRMSYSIMTRRVGS